MFFFGFLKPSDRAPMFYPEIGFSDGRVHSLFPIGSMGLVNLPTGRVHFYGKLVGKYTVRPMDPMGFGTTCLPMSPNQFCARS